MHPCLLAAVDNPVQYGFEALLSNEFYNLKLE